MQVVLGGTYQDRVTGFKGICTGICDYISGCSQALLNPRVGKDGAIKESCWFDVQRLNLCKVKVMTLNNEETPGFDKAAPKR